MLKLYPPKILLQMKVGVMRGDKISSYLFLIKVATTLDWVILVEITFFDLIYSFFNYY